MPFQLWEAKYHMLSTEETQHIPKTSLLHQLKGKVFLYIFCEHAKKVAPRNAGS